MEGFGNSIDPALARLLRSSFAKELCRSIDAHLQRFGMSPSRFGREAMNDPGFVGLRLRNGARVRLHSADRARAFMGEQTFGPVVVWETRKFLDLSGLKGWTAGDYAIGQRSFVNRLLNGSSPFLRTIDRFRRRIHRQLQPEQREAVWVAVARALARGSEAVDAPERPAR